jgi:hypothetical protein
MKAMKNSTSVLILGFAVAVSLLPAMGVALRNVLRAERVIQAVRAQHAPLSMKCCARVTNHFSRPKI